jgi:hypothetical protein
MNEKNLLKDILKKCLNNGYNPKELLSDVFNIIDKELDSNEVKYILYCGSYGGFDYSKEFKEYIKNYHSNTYFEREMYSYIEEFAKFLNISIDEALKRASGDYCKLKVKTIPKHREYIIHEYDGAESIEILKDFC